MFLPHSECLSFILFYYTLQTQPMGIAVLYLSTNYIIQGQNRFIHLFICFRHGKIK